MGFLEKSRIFSEEGLREVQGRLTYRLSRMVLVGLHIIIGVGLHGSLGDGGGLIGFWIVF